MITECTLITGLYWLGHSLIVDCNGYLYYNFNDKIHFQ